MGFQPPLNKRPAFSSKMLLHIFVMRKLFLILAVVLVGGFCAVGESQAQVSVVVSGPSYYGPRYRSGYYYGPGYYAPGYYWGPYGYRYYRRPYWRHRYWRHHRWYWY